MRPSTRLVASLLFCSGLSALLYQTAWQRSFRLLFGASTAASAAVLAVFLGGLGLGGLLLGRRAERSAKPLLVYGNLEVGVAVAAAVSPLLMTVFGKSYLALGGVHSMGQFVATVLRLAITALSIGPAVVLMGGTLPAAARAVEGDEDLGRSRLAVLYAANTTGAVGGALLGTFVLFEVFGIRLSLWIAALLNLLVAVIARSLGRDAEDVPVSPEATPKENDDGVTGKRGRFVIAYVVSGGVGFAFLLLEIVWYRMLAPILGGSTYTFGLVLAVALAGIGAGAFLYASRSENRPATLSMLAMVTTLEGVVVALPLAIGDPIALVAAMTRPLGALGFPALVASWTGITVFVVFGAAVVSGYQFPLLFAFLGQGRAQVARQVGTLYAFNTVGSIVGSLLGGLVLLPHLGAVGAWRLVAALLFALGLATAVLDAVTDPKRAPLRSLATLSLAALGIFLATRTGPTAVWRHTAIGAGRLEVPAGSSNDLRKWRTYENAHVAWQADGVETGVAIKLADQLAFVVDGKVDGAVFADRATQAGSGLIAALVHPKPTRAFVIGLGTGMTAGWLAAMPGMERVDVAELEPSILEMARMAAAANLNVLSRPNVTMHIGDGRELMLTSKEKYDLVVSEPSNPYRAGISAFYTREFYEAVKGRLRPGGIFVQWMQGYEIDVESVRTIARTLHSVLPHVETWMPEFGDILFLASEEARTLDIDRIRATADTEPFRSGLPQNLLIQDAEGLLGRFVATDVAVERLTSTHGDLVNTDDLNPMDYGFARSVGLRTNQVSADLLAVGMSEHADRPPVRGAVDWDRVAEERPRAWLVTETVPDFAIANDNVRARAQAVGHGCGGQSADAVRVWQTQPQTEPRDDVERFALGVGFADRGDERVPGWADRIASRGFVAEAELLRGRRALHDGKAAEAMAIGLRAIEAMRHEALPLCVAPRQILSLVRNIAESHPEFRRDAALALLKGPFAAYGHEEERIEIAQRLASASGDATLCVRALGTYIEHPRWDEAFLEVRLRCLAAAGHPLAEQAAQDLLDFRRGTPGTFKEQKP